MTENKKVTEEGIKNVLDNLSQGFFKKSQNEHQLRVAATIEEHGERLLKPEIFYLFVTFKDEEFYSVLLDNLLREERDVNSLNYDEKSFNEITNVYENYKFIELQLDRIFEKEEGNACSADKTRTVILWYLKYLKTGELVEWNRDNYSVPSYGSEENYLAFMTTMTRMCYGFADEFITARHTLIDEIVSARVKFINDKDEFFTNHEQFKKKEKSDRGITYHFSDVQDDNGYKIRILIFEKDGSIGYVKLKVTNGVEEKVEYGKPSPDWMEALLKRA